MQSHTTSQSIAESRSRPAQKLNENVPDLGELVPGICCASAAVDPLFTGRRSDSGFVVN